jgi:5-methylthioadenosine/S-adenosylhomocysteine deaminase
MSLKAAGLADTIRYSGGPVRLKARWLVPVDMPPIENGEVTFEDGIITFVGKATGSPATHDLGNVAILPGFVNTHTHLEYTLLRGMVEDTPFYSWIRTLTTLKAHVNLEDWLASATWGAAEMLATGITTIADATDSGASLGAIAVAGQRGIVYREVFGIEPEPTTETLLSLLHTRLVQMRAQLTRSGASERIRLGISPHAPYTVRKDLYQALATYSQRETLPQTTHIAESLDEENLIRNGEGAIADYLHSRGVTWKTPECSPTHYLDLCGTLTPGTLLAHTVHVSDEDIQLLRERNCTIAHCPKSNGKLAAGIAPVTKLLDAGIPVGLGTDSMVSNNTADIFEEMRLAVFFSRVLTHDVKSLTAKTALHMATLGGAAALGMESEIGSITRGKRADLCAVRLDGLHITPTIEDNPIAALVYNAKATDVALTLVGGRVVYEGGWHVLLDIPRIRHTITEARKRIGKYLPRIPAN